MTTGAKVYALPARTFGLGWGAREWNERTKGGSSSRCLGLFMSDQLGPRISSLEAPAADLETFRSECVQIFVRAAQTLSVPRSVGEIYGLLYGSVVPLPMDDIVAQLQMSKGSASQGLKWLRAVGAVRTTYVAGDRRDHFEAETELRKLALGFLRETVKPHVASGAQHLNHLDRAAEAIAAGADRQFARERAKRLRRWHRFASQMLPIFLRIAAKY